MKESVTNIPAQSQAFTPLTAAEKAECRALIRRLAEATAAAFSPSDRLTLIAQMRSLAALPTPVRNNFDIPMAIVALRTALLFASQIDVDRNIIIATLLFPHVVASSITPEQAAKPWNSDIRDLLEGLAAVSRFEHHGEAVRQENYRGLLLSLASDIRVIIIRIINTLVVMRLINHHPDTLKVNLVAFQANYLYAQLAHRLGLYKIKGELEDLYLKYTNREIYNKIAAELNATKRARDAYIAQFIAPVKEKLERAGLTFDIKGRTKSISSIWAKIKKQKVDMAHIYDLFAIRVIIDTPAEREKADCWLAYSIVADMYTANPARMKDWISIPKSNGYESLHATVMGPESKWVEVQFRTRRMDLVAEKGLAAHWRYKGIKSDSTDQWMNNIRDILESAESGPMELMKNLKADTYSKEVFAFTPKGDLFRLSPGSTVLDFAFHIHSNLGCRCSGAIVNSTHQKITYKIQNGDTVEILTSASQVPKQDWLNIVVSSKARNKIKQALNERRLREAELGKELLERRTRNRKIELDDTIFQKAVKKLRYKSLNDFYCDIAAERITPDRVLSIYHEIAAALTLSAETKVGADEYRLAETPESSPSASTASDILVIGDKDIKGLNYRLARCCSPIYGDEVFGFISADGVVKIHRNDCSNAPNMRARYPYRLIRVTWSGTGGSSLPATLRVTGKDDIGIVTNITSIINKEPTTTLRNITIDSHDGLFQGYLTIGVSDSLRLEAIIGKLRTVKGVKEVTRC